MTKLYTTAQVVAARLTGKVLTEEQKKIPLMEEAGFIIEYGSKGDIRFVRGRLHVWQIMQRGQLMWQTAILRDGHYQEHIPVKDLEQLVKVYNP